MVNNLELHSLVVENEGARLDKYVSERYPDLSRTHVQKLISDGYIKVNDRVARSGHKLKIGDRLTVSFPPIVSVTPAPECIPLNILYEDEDVMVIDKPAGLAVHPAPGHPSHTLVNAILPHLSNLPDTGDRQRPGIVHRLDKDTSGVMLVARNSVTQLNLVAQFKARSVAKTYLVLVKG
ncbi:pseudouridine synthase, partial [Chloroflexota bacterium]